MTEKTKTTPVYKTSEEARKSPEARRQRLIYIGVISLVSTIIVCLLLRGLARMVMGDM